MSALSQIFGEVDVRLSALPGVLEYERMPTGDPARFWTLHVYDDGDTQEIPEGGEVGVTRLLLIFHVEGFVQAYSGAAAHDDLNDLHALAVKALCGDAGCNLGGLVESIAISGQRRVASPKLGAARRLGFAQDFAVIYATPRGDPSILLTA